MVHLPKISQSSYAQPEVATPTVPAQQLQIYTRQELIKMKVAEIWNQFLVLLHLRPKVSVVEQIQKELNAVDEAEKQNNKPLLFNVLRRAFYQSMHAIQMAHLDPAHLPKNTALHLAQILGRFGIAIYASKDVQDPFQSPLDVLKTAILMQNYALGLSDSCPDLSKLHVLDDLYNNEALCSANARLADEIIDHLDPDTWADKISTLTQDQQLLVPQILRYANGAMRYLKHYQDEALKGQELSEEQLEQVKADNVTHMQRCGRLLNTARSCLKKSMEVEGLDQAEVRDQMAELIYNDLTGFAAAQAEEYEAAGKTTLENQARTELRGMWDECISLSKFPEKMQARVDNKRCFIEKLTLEEELDLRTSSLERHLSLPEDQQNPVLIALAFHNISDLFDRIGRPVEAFYAAIAAVKLVLECRAKGENNVQFDSVLEHANRLIAKYQWINDELEKYQAQLEQPTEST